MKTNYTPSGSAKGCFSFADLKLRLDSRSRKSVQTMAGPDTLRSGSSCFWRGMWTHQRRDAGLAQSRCDRDVDRQDGDIVLRCLRSVPLRDLPQEGRNAF